MIQEGKLVNGVDFKGNNINQGTVEHIVGFGDVAIVRISEDRTGLTQAYVSNLSEQK